MFTKKPTRPYLKVCTVCHGKGQVSHFNTMQEKKYGCCKKCTAGNLPNGGLGVTLKCTCQQSSAKYEFVRFSDLPYLKGVDRDIAKALKDFQSELGSEGAATCIMCDCGARFIVREVGERRKIRGEAGANPGDKQHNKRLAAELAARGITRVLRACPTPAAQQQQQQAGGRSSSSGGGAAR